MNELERNLKLSDSVLRYLSVLVASDVEPATVRAELEAHRRRSAEARAAADAARAAAEATRAAAAEAARGASTAAAALDTLHPPRAEEASTQSESEQGASSGAADSGTSNGDDEGQI
jgi:membrane protein involved in colicin uptake